MNGLVTYTLCTVLEQDFSGGETWEDKLQACMLLLLYYTAHNMIHAFITYMLLVSILWNFLKDTSNTCVQISSKEWAVLYELPAISDGFNGHARQYDVCLFKDHVNTHACLINKPQEKSLGNFHSYDTYLTFWVMCIAIVIVLAPMCAEAK